MVNWDIRIAGDDRLKSLSAHLESCYEIDDDLLPTNDDQFDESIVDIHRIHYSDAHRNLWTFYENSFSEELVAKAISELSIRKDAGPMLIHA